MSKIQDPDDIYRVIDEDKEDQRTAEVACLFPKLRALKGHFTAAYNVLSNLITATRGVDNTFDTSTGNQNAIERAREKLELRYEKLERCYNRMLSISHNLKTSDNISSTDLLEKDFQAIQDKYGTIIATRGQLMIDMLPKQAPDQGQIGGANQNLKPIEALKPSFTLDFENSPTELAAWMAQFKAYYEASRLHTLPTEQQQAFLRQGVHPDVWIAIQQKINMTTRIFKNASELDDDSCEKFIQDAFQIRYPLIMRRYRFFTYERKGNQTFTDFVSKLEELAAAANLESMEMNDYKMFRVIAGLNDSKCVDKILTIPLQDFKFEEVKRVGVQYQTAKNYSGLNPHHHVNQVVSKKNFKSNRNPTHNNKNSYKNSHPSTSPSSSIQGKLSNLRQQGKCTGCGRKAHAKGQTCPLKSATCHKCGLKGHIAPVCAQPAQKTVTRQVTSQKAQA